jgi:hypothetical protein
VSNLIARAMLVLVCSTACKSKPEQAQPGVSNAAASPSAGQAPLASSSSGASSVAAPSGLPEADVKAFVTRWSSAQNERDFAAYSRLYADRFMGVKRVGTYSKRFDRAAWLVDRRPMLEGSATVTVSDIEVVAAAGAARVIFTQEFVSAGFRDIGKKELFLLPSPAGIVISREEMLSSQASSTSVGGETVLAYQRDGAVVQRGFDERALGSQPRLLSREGLPLEITFDVEPAALGAEARAWLGREVTAYTSSGKSCTGRVARFEVRVQAVPHFGMRQTWSGQLDEPKATPQAIAKALQDMAQSEEYIVVAVLDSACAGSWASSSPQTFVPAVEAKGPLREAALSAFKSLPAYADLQRRFVKESKTSSAWETVDGSVRVLELRAPGRASLLLVSARSGAGCGDFNGSLSAFWEITGTAQTPKLAALAQPLTEYVTIHGAIDEGGPQGLALLAGPDDFDEQLSVLRLAPPKAARRVLLSNSFWDCGC